MTKFLNFSNSNNFLKIITSTIYFILLSRNENLEFLNCESENDPWDWEKILERVMFVNYQ